MPNLKVRNGPSGVHLFDRTSGVNVLLDEISILKERWSQAPRHVSIALTNACDLACGHCYAPKFRAALNIGQVSGWLYELDAHGCLGVGFGGGEPTLHPEFVDVCRNATEKTGLAVTFTTHALRINASLAQALVGSVHFVRVSMDGVGRTYETVRERPFADFLRGLDAVRSIARFGLNVVVNRATVFDLDAVATMAAVVGATELLLLPEQPVRGRGGIDAQSRDRLTRWVVAYNGPVPLAVSEAGASGLPTCDPFPQETGLRAYAHIDASGMLKRTSFTDAGVPVGGRAVMCALEELRTDGVEEL